MRFQLLAGALVVSLLGSAIAFAATGTRARARPDLVVASLANPPRVVLQGAAFGVRDETSNIGAVRAPASRTRYYLQSSNGARTVVGGRLVPALRAHRSSSGTGKATPPKTLAGTYTLVACADATNAVKETSERDNCRTAATKLIVKRPPPPV
jgi:hypothetical protein